jgi:hypothetical protein
MDKKCLMAIMLTFLCQLTFANTCPSIKDIKNDTLAGWKAYDSDEGTPLSSARVSAFKKNVQQFALAEWVNGGSKHGAIHCYYRDNNGSDLEAYLSKDHFTPRNEKNYWYEVSGFMQCAAGKERCEFEGRMMQQQLAKK